jgi:hypothetical protein
MTSSGNVNEPDSTGSRAGVPVVMLGIGLFVAAAVVRLTRSGGTDIAVLGSVGGALIILAGTTWPKGWGAKLTMFAGSAVVIGFGVAPVSAKWLGWGTHHRGTAAAPTFRITHATHAGATASVNVDFANVQFGDGLWIFVRPASDSHYYPALRCVQNEVVPTIAEDIPSPTTVSFVLGNANTQSGRLFYILPVLTPAAVTKALQQAMVKWCDGRNVLPGVPYLPAGAFVGQAMSITR